MKRIVIEKNLKIDDNDEDRFEKFLQERINRLCWLIKQPEVQQHHRNFLRVAIVTKHALIDFARIIKGRQSAQESLFRGGPCERQSELLQALRAELIGSGLAQARKGQKL